MVCYSNNKQQIEKLAKAYENLKHSTYYPAKVPKYNISRNSLLPKSVKAKHYCSEHHGQSKNKPINPKTQVSTPKQAYWTVSPLTARKLVKNSKQEGGGVHSAKKSNKKMKLLAKNKAKMIYKMNKMELTSSSFEYNHMRNASRTIKTRYRKPTSDKSKLTQNPSYCCRSRQVYWQRGTDQFRHNQISP